MKEIETLIPHRYPFLFVDEIISVDEHEIIGMKSFDDSFAFFQETSAGQKIVPSMILVEAMAQCGGAGVKKINDSEDGALYGLASIENTQFHDTVQAGNTIKMIIRNIKISNKIIKQSGTVYCKDKIAVEATWMCAKF